jgi:hypothetical protein
MTETLDRSVQIALVSVRNHESHALTPYHRNAIYKAIGSLASRKSGRVRSFLAIIAAQRALPSWHRTRPNDTRVEQLIDLAITQVRRAVADDPAIEKAAEAWNWLLNDYGDRTEELALDAEFAMAASLEAVWISLGSDRFLDVTIDETTTDADLDPWCSDAAMYAAVALSGPVWEEDSSTEQRLEYWEWWLLEAIPNAYREVAKLESMNIT